MKRIALIVIRLIWRIPYWWLCKIKKYTKVDKYSHEERYEFIYKLCPFIIKKGRINLECYGLENLPEQSGYLLAPNHQGLFDPVALVKTHQRPVRAIVKKELASVILVKDVVKMLEFIPMDRSNVREGMKIINYCAKQVAKGQNFFVYPEGTRSRKGNELLEFKGGTFKIALKAKAPIVPVAMIDCYKVFDVNTIKKTTAQIHYLKPIYYEEYQGMHTNDIAKMVQERIEACIQEYQPKE